jgi:MYXO-CTERM domain-containing protein
MTRFFTIALGVAAVLVGRTAVAHAACEFGPFELREVSPASGATDVPINTEIRLTYWKDGLGIDTLLTDIQLRAADGTIIDLDAQVVRNQEGIMRTMVVATLADDLVPDTRYEILSRIARPCIENNPVACMLEQHEPVAIFTTGAASDTTAPSFAGPTGMNTFRWLRELSSQWCGPYEAVLLTIGWQPATDDTPADTIRYHVYRDQTRVASYMTAVRGARGVFKCNADYFVTEALGDFIGQNGTYHVRAVDMAGNEDSNSAALDVYLRCDEDEPAGPDPGGCSVGNSTSSAFALWLLAALAALLLRRRARPGRGHQ